MLKNQLTKNLLIVSLVICTHALADKKSSLQTEESFWSNVSSIDLAYQPYKFYKRAKYTCMPTKILDAKLWMLEFWFWPHTGENRFNDLFLEKENKIIYFKSELRRAKRRNRKTFIIGLSIGAGVILGASLTIKVLN